MKKILVIAAMMAMFVACKSVEDKAKDYAEDIAAAVAEGDWEKAEKILTEGSEWYDSLDAEDKAKVDAFAEKYDGGWL